MAYPHTNGLVERYNGVVYAGTRKIITSCPEAHWTKVIGDKLAGLSLLPTRLRLSLYSLVFKQALAWIAAHSPTSKVGAMGDLLGEDSSDNEYWGEVFK